MMNIEENLREIYSPKYENMFEDIKKCLICGLPFTATEKMLHSFQHTAFIKCKIEYDMILSYEEIIEKKEENLAILENIEKNKSIEKYIGNLYLINFSYSLYFRGYNFNDHPDYEEYIKLLWNTENFQELILEELGECILNHKLKEYQYNYKLKETDITKKNFIFLSREVAV